MDDVDENFFADKLYIGEILLRQPIIFEIRDKQMKQPVQLANLRRQSVALLNSYPRIRAK